MYKSRFMLTSSSILNLHRVLFCTDIDLGDIMQIDCLAYKYFFNRFSLVGYNIWYCVVCDYRVTPLPPPPPPPPPNQPNLHLSENKMSINDNYQNNL